MSNAPFREFYEASPDAVVVIDLAGHILFANSRVEALLGYLPRELIGKAHTVLMPARFRDAHAGHIRRFMSNPTPRMMGVGLELVASRKDGSEFRTEISLSPYHAPDGLVVIAAIRDREALNPRASVLESENANLKDMLGQARVDSARLMAQAGIEAAEHEAAQRLQRLLMEELHHRIKNMLATVVAIASQTLRTAETLEQGRQAISSRLVAMGRAQDLLLRASEAGAELADVISAAIAPFDNREDRRFVVQNTLIEIAPGAILPLTMSLNELCTNAVKYGALSNETGRVNITSMVDETTQLFTLTWRKQAAQRSGSRHDAVLARNCSAPYPLSFTVTSGCDTNRPASCAKSTFPLRSYERVAPAETMVVTVESRIPLGSALPWAIAESLGRF